MTNTIRSTLSLITLLCLGTLANGQEQWRATVSLYAKSEVSNSLVRVTDIAKVYCNDAKLKKEIENLDVEFLSPKTGGKTTISAGQVRIRMRLADLHGIRVTGSKTMVQRKNTRSQKNTTRNTSQLEQTIRNLAAQKIKNALANFYQVPPDWVSVEAISITKLPRPDATALTIEILDSLRDLIGKRTISLVVLSNGKPLMKTQLVSSIIVSKNVLIATRDKQVNDRMLNGDYIMEKKLFVSRSINDALHQTNDNMVVKRPIRRGSILSASDFKKLKTSNRPVVASNDVVTVVAQKGRIRVTLAGAISLDSGKVGDSIRVKNPKTNKIFRAKIVSPTEIRAIY